MDKTEHTMALKEAKFDINELFFSITDRESTILSGNEVFVRISGYSKEELIGQYHNIVRNPDMPRVLFKVIWETIKESKPIAGYVKNQTKTGEYYWVFSTLFPLGDRYVSIRIKPTSKFFTYAQELYPVLLSAEHRGGMEESGAMIPTILNTLGYDDYDHFMSDALLSELQLRKGLISLETSQNDRGANTPLSQHLRSAHMQAKSLMYEYDVWFEKIDTFNRVKSIFEEKSLILRQVAREVVFLSLNASVSSYKIERGGETFGILARDVRTNAKENDELIEHIDTLVGSLSDSLNSLVFSVSGIRLQSEMMSYFIEELLCENCTTQRDEIGDNLETLVALVTAYAEKSMILQSQIDRQLQETLKYLDQLEQQMMYLGYIQVYGIIEAAGYRHEAVSFEEIFSQLKALIQKTSLELEVMQKMGQSFYTENRFLIEKSRGSVALKQLQETMITIKEMVG